MARSKYTFEKRQRENAKKKKQKDKLEQRMMAKNAKSDEGSLASGGEVSSESENIIHEAS